jgi:hypothetical protein
MIISFNLFLFQKSIKISARFNILNVERRLEYQQAWQIPAPQKFQLLTLKPVETFANMMTEAKCFYSMFLKEKRL